MFVRKRGYVFFSLDLCGEVAQLRSPRPIVAAVAFIEPLSSFFEQFCYAGSFDQLALVVPSDLIVDLFCSGERKNDLNHHLRVFRLAHFFNSHLSTPLL